MTLRLASPGPRLRGLGLVKRIAPNEPNLPSEEQKRLYETNPIRSLSVLRDLCDQREKGTAEDAESAKDRSETLP
jgi:hypothetical protein